MKGATIRRQFRREPVEQSAPPSRIARQLALAHHIQRLVESGEVEGYSQVAEKLGLTRARVTQIANLTLLPPLAQEAVLAEEAMMSERALRKTTARPEWP